MTKKLFRSQADKIIAGVAGGLAEYFEVDSTIVRLLFILITIMGGAGVLIYFILWLIMPRDVDQKSFINEEKLKEFAGEIKDRAQDIREDWRAKHTQREEIKNEFGRDIKKRGGFFGWLLVILGLAFLFKNFMPHWFAYQVFNLWPLAVIVVGLYLIAKRK